jgi:fermentation-respiration switch protein FrsA (DUF1100 family)
VLCVLLLVGRNRIVFPIRGGAGGDPRRYGIPDGERVQIPSADGERLTAWLLPPRGEAGAAGAVIWFHGNGETVAGLAPVIRELRPEHAALLAVEYRGYGESSGTPTVANVQRDAEAAWEWLATRPEIDSSRIVVYGRSLGTGPALQLGATRPVAGLVLESAFTTLRALARAHYAIFPAALAGSGFDNLAAIARVRAPVLFIHGDADRIIPIAMGRELAARVSASEFWVIRGADHNDTYDSGADEYARRFKEFVARVAESGK